MALQYVVVESNLLSLVIVLAFLAGLLFGALLMAIFWAYGDHLRERRKKRLELLCPKDRKMVEGWLD